MTRSSCQLRLYAPRDPASSSSQLLRTESGIARKNDFEEKVFSSKSNTIEYRIRPVNHRIPVPLLAHDNRRPRMISTAFHAHLREDHTRRRTVLGFLPDDQVGIIPCLKVFNV